MADVRAFVYLAWCPAARVLGALMLYIASLHGGYVLAEDRDYQGVFGDLTLSEEVIAKIKRFDQFVFQGNEDKFYTPFPSQNGEGFFRVKYIGGLKFNLDFLRLNDFAWSIAYDNLIRATPSYSEASVLILGVDTIDENILTSHAAELDIFFRYEMSPTLGENLHTLDQGRCAIARVLKEYQIEKTVIFVKRPKNFRYTKDQEKSVISCINRGQLYHLGFSNVLAVRSDDFVELHPSSNKFIVPNLPGLPRDLRSSNFAGAERIVVLRRLAEQNSK